MFENLETYLLKDDWETILDKDIKRIIVLGITEAARREIIPFLNLGAAFEKCEAGVFFVEMIKKILTTKIWWY